MGLVVAWSALNRSRWDLVDAASGVAAASAARVAEAALARRSAVLYDVCAVRVAAVRLEQTEQLLQTYELTVLAEQQRYAVGEASLLEVVSAVDDRQRALIDRVSGRSSTMPREPASSYSPKVRTR